MTFNRKECESFICDRFAYTFNDPSLLETAYTHKSYYHEHVNRENRESSELEELPQYTVKGWGQQNHNERLEFLGDAVLDLILSHLLMQKFRDIEEGGLSKLRASLVNEAALFEIAKVLKVKDFVCLGKGEFKTGGADKPRILASVIEALIGAIYIDQGFEAVKNVVEKMFSKLIENINLKDLYIQDYKTRLQEHSQKVYTITPSYEVIHEEGPSHEKFFKVKVNINAELEEVGEGNSKKQAAQVAAQKLLEKMNEKL